MNLYLIVCGDNRYATNAFTHREAGEKFKQEYDFDIPFTIQEITPEELVELEDNDSIIFF